MILLIVGGLSLLVIVFFRAYNAPLPTITHWTRDATGAALSVGTYSNPDYASYEWTQRALAYTGGALLAAGIAWCLI